MDFSRRTLGALGAGLIGLAAVLGLVALEHMRTMAAYGYICGAQPHCPACPASVAALLLGLTFLGLAARAPARRRIRLED